MPTIQFTYDDSARGIDFERTVTVRYAVVPAEHSASRKTDVMVLSAVDEEELAGHRHHGIPGDCDHLDLLPDSVYDRLLEQCRTDMQVV